MIDAINESLTGQGGIVSRLSAVETTATSAYGTANTLNEVVGGMYGSNNETPSARLSNIEGNITQL